MSGWQALLLAGGRSSRMGQDKAMLPWRGRPLLDHITDLLRDTGATEVWIAGRQSDGRGIADRWPDIGPIGGMASALPLIADGRLLVLPVDMPLLDAATLQPLVEADDATALRYHGAVLPLRLEVDANLRNIVERLVKAGHPGRSLTRLFTLCGGREIAPPDGATQRLVNCNTPEDWQAALAAPTGRLPSPH